MPGEGEEGCALIAETLFEACRSASEALSPSFGEDSCVVEAKEVRKRFPVSATAAAVDTKRVLPGMRSKAGAMKAVAA